MDQDKGRQRCYDYDYTTAACQEHHVRYYQQISGLDDVIGQIVDQLKQQGLDKNTIIVFASDHGLLMGEYGMGGKGLLYDLSAKIPCFIVDPTAPTERAGTICEELVSSLDITATILDYAGLGNTNAPASARRVSRRPCWIDWHARACGLPSIIPVPMFALRLVTL